MDEDDREEFLKDLSLTVPNVQEYNMIDWFLLSLWAYSALMPAKNLSVQLLYISTAEMLWGMYGFSNSEYAQSVVFFCHALVMMFAYLKHPLRMTL